MAERWGVSIDDRPRSGDAAAAACIVWPEQRGDAAHVSTANLLVGENLEPLHSPSVKSLKSFPEDWI